MEHERFSFLELPGHDAPPSYRLQQIPDNQYLNYLDLLALKPTPGALRRVSRKLMEKYRFVPIVSQAAQLKMRLPGYLEPVYHIQYKLESTQISYLAICPPEKELALQLIYNALGHGFYGIPIRPDTFERFLSEKYQELKGK